jgi:hypothetical protein
MHGLKVNGLSLTGSALTVTILYSTYEVCTETRSRRVQVIWSKVEIIQLLQILALFLWLVNLNTAVRNVFKSTDPDLSQPVAEVYVSDGTADVVDVVYLNM